MSKAKGAIQTIQLIKTIQTHHGYHYWILEGMKNGIQLVRNSQESLRFTTNCRTTCGMLATESECATKRKRVGVLASEYANILSSKWIRNIWSAPSVCDAIEHCILIGNHMDLFEQIERPSYAAALQYCHIRMYVSDG